MKDVWIQRSFFALFLLLGLIALLFSCAPPVRVDSLVYHLALPKLYNQAGHWFDTPENIYSYFPNLVESGYRLLMRFHIPFPQILHACIGIAVSVQTLFLSKRVGLRRVYAWVAVFGVLLTPEFFKEMTWAYVDLASVFFWQWAVLLFLNWRDIQKDKLLCLMGVAAAGAISVKYTGLLLVLVLALLVLSELRRRGRNLDSSFLIHSCIAAVVFLLLTSWWSVRNWIVTGNPMFPFFEGVFGANHSIWSADKIQLFMQFVNQYGAAGDMSMWHRIVGSVRIFFTLIPSLAVKFDGVYNVWFIVAFGSLFWLRKNAVLRILWLVISVKGMFWVFSTQQVRFALELVPFFAILSAFFLQKMAAFSLEHKTTVCGDELTGLCSKAQSGAGFAGGVSSNLTEVSERVISSGAWMFFFRGTGLFFCIACALNISNLGFYFYSHHYLTGIQPSKRELYLQKRLPYYKVYQYIHANTPDHAMIGLVLCGAQTYYLDRPFFTDTVFEERRFKEMLLSSKVPEDVYKQMRASGWSYLFTYLPAYQPASWLNPEYHSLMKQVFRGMKLRCQDNGYLLFEIPPAN